jgi:hypothetical protein
MQTHVPGRQWCLRACDAHTAAGGQLARTRQPSAVKRMCSWARRSLAARTSFAHGAHGQLPLVSSEIGLFSQALMPAAMVRQQRSQLCQADARTLRCDAEQRSHPQLPWADLAKSSAQSPDLARCDRECNVRPRPQRAIAITVAVATDSHR